MTFSEHRASIHCSKLALGDTNEQLANIALTVINKSNKKTHTKLWLYWYIYQAIKIVLFPILEKVINK